MLRAMKEKAQSMQQSAQVAGTPALPQGELELRRAREEMEVHKEQLLVASRAVSGGELGEQGVGLVVHGQGIPRVSWICVVQKRRYTKSSCWWPLER